MADYGFDTTDLEKLIASLSRAQAPTDEDRSAARSQALQVAGLSLLGTPKGQVWGRAGQAGMNALAAKNDYLAGIPKQRQAALQSATQAMSLQEQLRGLQDQQAFQQRLQGGLLTGGGAVPPSSIATPSAPPMGEAGGFSAPGVAPPQAPAQAPSAPPQDYYAKAMQQADALEAFAQSGQPGAQAAAKLARDTREQALKWRDENTGVETVMGPNGPMLIQRRKHGDPTQLPYQPKPDIKEVSTNTEKFFIDPLTQKRYGDSFQMGISPADTQRLGLERQRLAQAERHHQDTQKTGSKPQWDSASGQFVIAPSETAPTGSAVTPTGYKREDKPLTESQAKASAFANQMSDASSTLANLEKEGFSGKTRIQQAQIVNAGAQGIPFVPGSAAIPRAFSGEKAQKFQQAELQWTEGALRFMTGANAPEAEVVRNAATYFPRPGDSDKVIEQKAASRRNMEESVRLATGAGSKQLPALPKQQKATNVRSAADRILAGEN